MMTQGDRRLVAGERALTKFSPFRQSFSRYINVNGGVKRVEKFLLLNPHVVTAVEVWSPVSNRGDWQADNAGRV